MSIFSWGRARVPGGASSDFRLFAGDAAAFPGQGERLQKREMLSESSTNTFAKLSAPAELLFAGKQLQTDAETPPDSVEEPAALQCLPPEAFSQTFFPRESYLPVFAEGFRPPSTNHFTDPGLQRCFPPPKRCHEQDEEHLHIKQSPPKQNCVF